MTDSSSHSTCMRGTGTPVRASALHDAELALDGVRRRQQLGQPGRACCASRTGARRDQLVGRVGLPALELLDRQRAGEAGQLALSQRSSAAVSKAWLAAMGLVPVNCSIGVRRLSSFVSQRSAMASSLSRDSTTSRVGSMRTAPFALEALELLVDALARRAQQLRQVFLGQLQADADLLALLDAVALGQQQQLLGQAGRSGLVFRSSNWLNISRRRRQFRRSSASYSSSAATAGP
jgi:hypothetical protein